MSALPLLLKHPTLFASVYALPHEWARPILTSTAIIIARPISSFPFAPNSHPHRLPPGWRLTPCFPAHDRSSFCKLGFRGHRSSFSSQHGGGGLTRMGSENRADRWPPEDNASSPPDNLNFRLRQPPSSPPSSEQKLLTLPTILTIGRVVAVPLLVGTFYMDSCWGSTATTSIFIAAAITDWLDGYLARKMRLGTAFGAFLDPVADKLMVAATLILLCSRPLEVPMFAQMQWLLTVPAILIIGREITMSAVREWAASQNGKLSEAVAVNNLGKWKTATQMTALTILLATRNSSLSGSGTLVASGVALLYISAWLSLWSLVVYMRKIWKVLLK
ncbi:CDP-diacylglycerol--glycerol-3-phosphate 3-phosphatidyltransferase 2-like [Diospyros lotus]|uniref:CDP-diacylglycerol--glycerol-3-phosphate 3-phosphatidyltransferase 2-like n=1 Tax=Diospyros lotus TaxID=55363 RepID=UPI0022575964|nr:CDP-diacylglycerol--glycerol-3-phosphate 3-phosphatidyltransferase 2-like [Diospyros lotus]